MGSRLFINSVTECFAWWHQNSLPLFRFGSEANFCVVLPEWYMEGRRLCGDVTWNGSTNAKISSTWISRGAWCGVGILVGEVPLPLQLPVVYLPVRRKERWSVWFSKKFAASRFLTRETPTAVARSPVQVCFELSLVTLRHFSFIVIKSQRSH